MADATVNLQPTYALNRWSWRCYECDHVVTTLTVQRTDEAMQDHLDHIHRTVDHTSDPHYEDRRMDQLLAS